MQGSYASGGVDADNEGTGDVPSPHLRQLQRLELLGLLSAGLIHNFNNVLAIVSSVSDELLAALPEGDRLRADVEAMRHAVQHGCAVTRQLSQLAKPRARSPHRVELNSIVLDVANMARLLLGSDVRLELQLATSDAPVLVDSWDMEQVLLNLILNARDALPSGGSITLTTACLTYTAATAPRGCALRGPVCRVRVEDNGSGIDEATRAHVFEPFFTTKHGRGTGLGLPMVQHLVKAAGGCVELASRPDVGTTVDVVLPHADAVSLCAA